MTSKILKTMILGYALAAPAGHAASIFYYNYPLSGDSAPLHYSIGGGNHPSGGSIELGEPTSTGTYSIQYSKGIYGGSVDTEFTALELASGHIHVSYRDPVAPYDLSPESTGDKRAEYVGRILGMKQVVDLAFHGNEGTFYEAGNQPHPALAEVAAYLDAVIKNDLSGGMAPNGIQYCINARGWGEPFACGGLRCEKTGFSASTSCVVGAGR